MKVVEFDDVKDVKRELYKQVEFEAKHGLKLVAFSHAKVRDITDASFLRPVFSLVMIFEEV